MTCTERRNLFIKSIFITIFNIVGFSLILANYLGQDKDVRDWTWKETGAVITFAQTGFWFPLENLPSAKRRWWVTHKPLQIAIYAFSTVPMICSPLVKNTQAVKDGPEMYTYLVASAVMFSLSGFNAYLMSIKMMKYDCDKKSDNAGEVAL